ncbi:MAG: hypothetical protein PHY92_04160 [Alphaproteobacteria bacterium]|nr:hypothetical protein [Alphaproteobacteria bacterium]
MSGSSPKNGSISHLTAIVLTSIVFLCVVLIGVAGVIKHNLDRSEIALAAPDISFAPDEEVYEKILHALGYGGFLEAASRVITMRDSIALADMKQSLKTAKNALAHLPEKTPAAARHDIEGLVSLYDAILKKAEQSVENSAVTFTAADLAPAYASLPVLDTRLQAAAATGRLEAQGSFRLWGLSLTLVAWFSLILAAAMAAGLYLALHNRQAVPLRALAQSVQNLTRGDMHIPVWGMERQDAIGELARSIDLARYHFSQLPDISLMSEQGPVRLKFEGETRSLFEAMMRNISEEYERARADMVNYSGSLAGQQDALTSLSARLNALSTQLQQQGTAGHAEMQKLVQKLASSAQAMAVAQEKNVAQMNALVPYMQERAHNMAEVTHIAGSQIAQTLQDLMKAEQDLRGNAEQSAGIVDQFASNTNQMSERLFAAVNLMQASGKVLSETTDTVQSRFNEAIDTLNRGEGHLQQIMERVDERLSHTAKAEENMAAFASRAESNLERMEGAVGSMATRHEQLSEQVVMATHRMESVVASFDSAQRSMSDAMQQVRRDGEMLSTLLQDLRTNNEHLLKGITQNSETSYGTVENLAERSQKLLTALESQVAQQSVITETRLGELVINTQTLNEQVQTATTSLNQTVASMREEHTRFSEARSRFSDSVNKLGNRLEEQATATITKTEQWASQSFGKLTSLTDNMESLMQRLNILGQLTGTLGSVAGQLGQLMPALTQAAPPAGVAESPLSELLLEELQSQLKAGWHDAMTHIEAMHDQLAQVMVQQKDQLEMRLVVMDKKLKVASEAAEQGTLAPDQVAIMEEIVTTLAKISEHLMILDSAVRERSARQA